MKTMSWMIFLVVLICGLSAIALAETADDDKTLSPYFLVKSASGAVEQFPLLFTSAEVNIAGVIADVKVTQIYKNEGTAAIEAIYVFPASTRAAVYGMTMTIGERVIEAKIREREQAKQEYEQAKQEGKTASLLEQQRPNMFQMSVANILPGDKIKVELRYTELLTPTDGVYEFVYPTVVGPRYSNQPAANAPANDQWVANPYLKQGAEPPYLFDITTNLAAGMPIQEISCGTHDVKIVYQGASNATITLNEQEIIEKIQSLPPDQIERLKDAVKDLYGEDFGNVPAFYKKLFGVGVAYAEEPAEQEERLQQRTVKEFGGDRDYILKYRLAGGQIASGLLLYEGADENFFLLMMQPPQRVQTDDLPPREYIFIVDVSGSMDGFPLQTSKTLLKNLIGNLRPADAFNVLLFAGDSTIMSDTSVSANQRNIQRALGLIDRQGGRGGTELLPALERALKLPKTDGVARTIVIITDGFVNVETRVFDLIRQNLNRANMFTFGIGSSVNRLLIDGMARVGSGEPFVVTNPNDAPPKADQFRRYIQSPVLTGIETDFGDFQVYDVEPASVPDVLAERPVILFGKWKGEPTGQITLSGFAGRAQYTQTFNVSEVYPSATNSALRYLWARKRIELLGDYNALSETDERKLAITNLGLTYNLLTAYTSFVAIDKEIRRTGDQLQIVKQPLPLPKGVPNTAVGGGSVPEPTTLVLVGLGLIGILTLRRKSGRK